jgi:hypothetical protein
MTDADIEAALDACANEPRRGVNTTPITGLTRTSRKRVMHGTTEAP